MILKLTLPIPPSVNSYLNYSVKRSGHKFYVHSYESSDTIKYKNNIYNILFKEISTQSWVKPDNDKFVIVEQTLYLPHKRIDSNNLWKLPLDVFQGIIYNNDNKVIERTINIFIDKNNPRVEYNIYIMPKMGIFTEDEYNTFINNVCINCKKNYYKKGCSVMKSALNNIVSKEIKNNTCSNFKKID